METEWGVATLARTFCAVPLMVDVLVADNVEDALPVRRRGQLLHARLQRAKYERQREGQHHIRSRRPKVDTGAAVAHLWPTRFRVLLRRQKDPGRRGTGVALLLLLQQQQSRGCVNGARARL